MTWISVDERLPEEEGWVLAVRRGEVFVYKFFPPHFWGDTQGGLWDSEITHWAPFPEPPEEKT